MAIKTIIFPSFTPPYPLPSQLCLPRTSWRPPPSLRAAGIETSSGKLICNAACNAQVIVNDDEPPEKLLSRFNREVRKAGIIQECRRRRYFESTLEKRKRKAREASRRNRKRKPWSKTSAQKMDESPKKKQDDPDWEDDNWDYLDVDLPYC